MRIKIMDKILKENDACADDIRHYLKENSLKMFNIIGSPGSGKTTLLEKAIELLKDDFNIGIIEGDIATACDAQRIARKGVPVCQINTGGACHLSAAFISQALKEICGKKQLDLVFVENIGNLICPAEFDIGEDAKIAVLSVTEGDDKLQKYPLIFSEAGALILTKQSLLKYTNFNMFVAIKSFREKNKNAPIFKVDSLSGYGFAQFVGFIRERCAIKGETLEYAGSRIR